MKSIWESKIYSYLETFSNFFLLNLVWLLMCVPVVTAYPATTALFSVVRDWVKGKESNAVRSFFVKFKENFWQSLGIGIVWMLLGSILIVNFVLIGFMSPFPRSLLYVFNSLFCLLYTSTSVYIFPVMVNFEVGWLNTLRNSLLFSISQLITTLQCLLLLGISAFLVMTFPLLALIAGSVVSYLIYWLCERAFSKVAHFNGTEN